VTSLLPAASHVTVALSPESRKAVSIAWSKKRKQKSEHRVPDEAIALTDQDGDEEITLQTSNRNLGLTCYFLLKRSSQKWGVPVEAERK
jgi:hypothetical protein